MAGKRDFDIAFVGLKPGNHEFNYSLDKEFFREYDATQDENLAANVKLVLDKKAGFMLLRFDVGGTAGVSCDRCGNPLNISLWDEFNVVVKMVDNPDEMNAQEEDPDVYYISRTESHLHVKDWLYEFVTLSIPQQHFCGTNEKGESLCNPEVLEKLKEMENRVSDNTTNNLWKGLEKFKDNN